jgi:tryptophan synthase alpha subunit
LSSAIIIGVIVLILIGASLTMAFGRKQAPIKVQTEKVARRSITELVVANGRIQPVVQVVISPEVAGEITDLPVEESREYLAEMRNRSLATVFLAAPTSTDARLKQIAVASSGFVYAVSRTGVTGARQQMPEDAPKLVGRLRRYTDLPVAVGFGISTSEQIRAVGKFADAAVVGSAIVEIIERNPGKEAESVAQFVGQLSVVGRQSSALQR